ncbi:uncharacterized protein LOC108596554 isoform X2 [Drosophila busckii]|uniref:uncharacterized protein LOC108596554 isoform X2 n=1 Tax=Drosophila busckii TaxID=30019 RepID=UPI00083EDFD4|nr:uncharacterized protein LOC108596554 isoform X2 [Drosophila busckii]
MLASRSISTIFVLCGIALSSLVYGQTIDCQRPPRLDPAQCCRDGGRDMVAEKCAQKIIGPPTGQMNGPPSPEAATCVAECILTTAQYLQEAQKLNAANIRNDLVNKFSNDTAYVEAMVTAFTKCEPQAQRRLAVIQQYNQQQPKCSPFSALLLGCTYMEYFKNCPAHRWTQNAECTLAKTFVTQCGLGAQ